MSDAFHRFEDLREHMACCWCRYVQSELVHSRFAMAAVAGILIPEVRSQAIMPCIPLS